MNKADLVSAVAAKSGLSRGEAARAVDSTFATISESLEQGDGVKIMGFGSFSVIERAGGEARNPRTGQKIRVPRMKAPRFRPGLPLKDKLNAL